MPKPATYPQLFDSCYRLSIKKLIEWKYLEPNKTTDTTVNWNMRGEVVSRIGLQVDTTTAQPFIILDYKSNGEARRYKVDIVSKCSNLGKGLIYYFVCPQTKKQCRHLYNVGGWFLHRTAFNNCMYQKQTESKRWRSWSKDFAFVFDDAVYSELYKKHLKKTYNGKITKKYSKLLKRKEKIERTYKNEALFDRLMKMK